MNSATFITCEGPPTLEINSGYLAWDDPFVWHAITHLARATPSLSIIEIVDYESPDFFLFKFDAPSLAPKVFEGPPGHLTFTSSPTAYKHYLHRFGRVLEEVPSVAVLCVKSDENDHDFIVDTGGILQSPKWAVAAAEGQVTALLSLRSNATLRELSLSGFYGCRLAFPAPDGGSWIQPGVDSFAQAYLALVKANRALKKIELGNLAQWCRPTSDDRPSLPDDAATIFSESSITRFPLRYVTLGPADDAFLTSAIAHSRNLVRLSISGCDFNDRQAQVLAAALSQAGTSCPLKELLVEDMIPLMTDDGLLHFADIIPQCGLTHLTITLNEIDGENRFGIQSFRDVGDRLPTASGLAAVLRGLELNTTLRHLVISPVSPCGHFKEFAGKDYDGPESLVSGALLPGIKRELDINADPEKRALTNNITAIYIHMSLQSPRSLSQ